LTKNRFSETEAVFFFPAISRWQKFQQWPITGSLAWYCAAAVFRQWPLAAAPGKVRNPGLLQGVRLRRARQVDLST
jgi:hypothetical protein